MFEAVEGYEVRSVVRQAVELKVWTGLDYPPDEPFTVLVDFQ